MPVKDRPQTRYAKAPDGTSIAYQVVGDGPVDLVYSSGIWSNVEVMWEDPDWAYFLERLASFSRLIVFDMRGIGLSDRGPEPPSIELQRDDIAAVMDAVGIDDAVCFAGARAGTMTMLFAATHPDRTSALVLYAPVAKTVATPDFPFGKRPEDQQAFVERFVREMGTGRNLALQAPSRAGDERFVAWWARFERLVASPSGYEELAGIFTEVDVRQALTAIHAPTLVIHRLDDRIVFSPQVQYVADQIKGARLVELPGVDHVPFIGDADAILDEVEEFVTGARPAPRTDRVLATVLFTDIVGSTERQASLGDRGWTTLVKQHHAAIREVLTRFRGLEQDTAGDGFYVRFDGPAHAIQCAQEIVRAVRELGIEVRAGVHTGECDILEGKCSGLSVSIGARVMDHAGPSEVLVSQTVKDLTAGSGLVFEDAGEHELKGVPNSWRLYRVAT
ncbi:MAG TPA: adenylate/guanylate cyclase domain-containing protein [Actinomycetota bacterium]|nr:adenylate/guanylate cyclase domain-containing protein [Actinomycetota bacterium]